MLMAGCARIADPKPPERRVPEAARDLETRRTEEEIVLTKNETRDVFPPAPPGNFTIVAEAEKITLFWTPSPSNNVSGYRIFRKIRTENREGSRQLLREELITGISYRDESIEPGGDYIYEIQAVDRHGNASEIVITP